jgi:hypothetical protein
MAQGKGVGAKKKKQSAGSIKAKQGRTKKGLKKNVKSRKVLFVGLFFFIFIFRSIKFTLKTHRNF